MIALLAAAALAAPAPVVLWHSWRGAEERALGEILRDFHREQDEIRVEAVALPFEALAAKITTAVPRGHGPDLYIFAHERLGGWARAGIVAPLTGRVEAARLGEFLPETVAPLGFEGKIWGLPLAFKSLALYYNRRLVARPPATTDELLDVAAQQVARGRFGLAYEAQSFYHHAPWYFGFGAAVFGPDGRIALGSRESIASLEFVRRLGRLRAMPDEPSGDLVARLFNQGRAAMVISGPWFLGEIAPGLDFGVARLPTVSETGLPARPFLTDEAVFVSARARSPDHALAAAWRLAGPDGALTRALTGRQLVAHRSAWEDPRVGRDPALGAFRAQLAATVPMDARPEMRDVWEPAALALKKIVRGEASPRDAARAAERRLRAVTRPLPPAAAPFAYAALGAAAALVALLWLGRAVARVMRGREAARARRGWRWISPAMIAAGLLVLAPFAVGLGLSLFAHRDGEWRFVGLANFADILGASSYAPTEPLSFYFALAVTIAWTAVNVAAHVAIGLALALLLDRPGLRLRPLWRVLLVLPWAVPSYITALLWKGLFHKQFGAINALLDALGFDPVAWWSSFPTAFFANVCANVWLGVPFMMIVALGALQSIPRDLYEAADVDGASAWQRFRHVTLPLLGPALAPAVLLGMVWTFNQFNVVYLVSGGEPDNATDILVSEAYRWAFGRREQYGYAAAYAALIFALLLGFGAVSARVARRAEAAR